MNSVSVIIPLFNKEAYVADCLTSILAQTLKPLEVIVVDDGSTDSSLDVMRGFKDTFDRANIELHIVECQHTGVSHALNVGFAQARGVYVTRIDADDAVSPLWLATLLAQDKAHKPVSIRCAHKRIMESATLFEHKPVEAAFTLPDLKSGGELYHQLFAQMDTNLMSVCGSLYVRDNLIQDKISFNETLTHTEDVLFNAQYFAHGNPAILVTDELYFYRQVEGSLSHATRNLFGAVTTLDTELTKLTEDSATKQIALENEHVAVRYLCWYYSIALLDLEKSSSKAAFETAVDESLVSSSIERVFSRAAELNTVPQLAQRLYSLAYKKQYAQLRLVARTINLGRSIRRSFKAH